ncbi:MATE family efflux transporter [Desertibaculum subflavum]|uniref:MATE family efflux transporter n=1 Tax=Desertibaculum subflavum TaxID=2268458 RepID=UPI000E663B6D
MHAPAIPAATLRPVSPLLVAPILPTLLRLSLPNMAAMLATALVAIAETVYVGLLGTAPLAGMALVFPMVMLMQTMSAGAMGGGVSSAVSRALGAGDEQKAEQLALHAVTIGALAGIFFLAVFLAFGTAIYTLLGGRDAALDEALRYSNIIFLGAPAIWLTNTLASVVRGTGNMKVPSATLFLVAAAQVVIGGSLGLGLGPMPKLGMVGVGLGQAIAFSGGTVFLLWFLLAGRGRVTLRLGGLRLRREMFYDILKVGAVACLSPVQTVLTVLILTRLIASFGTEALAGYGIGSRLEFLLIPITFAIGVACVPLVGMAIGAGDVARARRVAWTGGLLSAVIVGAVGTAVAVMPDLWAMRFTDDPAVLASARAYLIWSGPGYVFFGLGLCLYFASQGAGKVLGPVLAGTLRLAVVALGGWWLASTGAPQWSMFALVGVAMAAFGIAAAAAVWFVPWGRPTR